MYNVAINTYSKEGATQYIFYCIYLQLASAREFIRFLPGKKVAYLYSQDVHYPVVSSRSVHQLSHEKLTHKHADGHAHFRNYDIFRYFS